jgi:phospholipase C
VKSSYSGASRQAARTIAVITSFALLAGASCAQTAQTATQPAPSTSTPITHLVVIFQENVSFDHYFGTYPYAQNPSGEPPFTAAASTPSLIGLSGPLLTANPNGAQPQRLDRSQPVTCDMSHDYTAEQRAMHAGLVNAFIENTAGDQCTDKTLVLDYYDGNTVTAMWNYAQHSAISDNSFGTTYGPSTPGALNLVAGQTHGATPAELKGTVSNGTVINDARPTLDECWKGDRTQTIIMAGRNIGDLLTANGVSWGWFQGGFRATAVDADGKALCDSVHQNVDGATVADYLPHHNPFQYYQPTANPSHTPPASLFEIGHDGPANHQYDLADFWEAADAGRLPAVSYLKAAAYQDGHAGYSDPLDEQGFLVETINHLQRLPTWSETAVIVAYDDSDGWYDHVMPPVVSQSNDSHYDALTEPGACGTAPDGAYQDRCGYGPRLPLLIISPYARINYVDHTLTDQSSIARFIEDNWNLGRLGDQSADAIAGSLLGMFDFQQDPHRSVLLLDPTTGEVPPGQ